MTLFYENGESLGVHDGLKSKARNQPADFGSVDTVTVTESASEVLVIYAVDLDCASCL